MRIVLAGGAEAIVLAQPPGAAKPDETTSFPRYR